MQIGSVVAISIILLSNEKQVNDWSGLMQPGVLLAYSSTFANTMLGFSFAYGCATQFWVQAISGRMRLTDLYYHYEGATSVWGAITALARGRVARVSLGNFLQPTHPLLDIEATLMLFLALYSFPSCHSHLPASRTSHATSLGC